jgi:propionyl-CoA synthetase
VVSDSTAESDLEQLTVDIKDLVRSRVGGVASLAHVCYVAKLPKTRSGKILRGTLRSMAEGKNPPVPATIEDASVLDTLQPLLHSFAEADAK